MRQHHDLQAAVCLVLSQGLCTSTGSHFLDIASSAGHPAVPLAQEFQRVQVVSTDLSPNSVKLAAARGKELGLTNFQAEVADAQNLTAFKDNYFAVVTCTFGVMFIPEYEQALREVRRVLQPGGLFAITLWAEEARSQNLQVGFSCCVSKWQQYQFCLLPLAQACYLKPSLAR